MTQARALPQPGDVIAGKYRVERTLGAGGMGAVFEVTHQITQRHFAIKWLLPELAASEQHAKRFVRESMVAGRLDHPHVVQVYDIGQEGTASFMVMELLHGESLAARLTRAGRFHFDAACELLLPCLSAVAAAHRAGIIHRDLKPANIFVCEPGPHMPEIAKVLDFGISKFLPSAGVDAMRTETGVVMGTPHYMAPEQMRSLPLDRRADVYALGVVFYELLSGRRPFDATSYPELVIKVVSEAVTPLDRLVPDLPPGVSAVVSRAMERDREARFQTVEAFAQALENLLEGNRGSAPRLTVRENERPHSSRPPMPQTPMSSESFAAAKPPSSGAWRAVALGVATLAGAGIAVVWLVPRPDVSTAPKTEVVVAPAVLDAGEPQPHGEPIIPDETPVEVAPPESVKVATPPPPTAAVPERPRPATPQPQLTKPRKPEPVHESSPPPPAAAPEPAQTGPNLPPKFKLGSEDFDLTPSEATPSSPKPRMDPSGF